MNPKLDRRLGRLSFHIYKRLTLEEAVEFVDAAVRAKDFNDLPQVYKHLVLEIEKSDPPPERLLD